MAEVRQDKVQIKLEIDGSQSRTELDNLTRKAQVLVDGMKGLKKGSDEYIAANKELSQVKNRMGELRQEIGLTSLNQAELGRLSKQLGRELAQLTPNTEAFLNKAQELADVDARLAQVRREAKGVKEELDNAGGGVLDFIKKAVGFAGIQLGVQALLTGLRQLGSESIDAAVKGSDAISDMEKSLNVTTEEAHALREALEGIDTRTSEENLEGIAIAAGQLGIAKDEALAFTESVNQANVALGDEFTGGVEEVTKSLGGLQKLFKDTADLSPADSITKIGSAVNALGAEGMASGPVMTDFTARLGQLGDLAPEITNTLGLAAAFQELGLSAEISAGGVSNVLLTAAKDTAGFAQQLGLTEEEFKQLLNADPNEVLLRLADSLKGASNTEIVATLDQLGIKSQEAVKTVSLLASQTDFVRQKQALASAEFAKGTSLLDEYQKKNTNAAAEVEKAEKNFAAFRLELGELLLPVYVRLLQYGALLVGALRALPGFVSENKTAFGLLALAVLSFNAAQIKAQATTLQGLALQKLVALGLLTETAGKYSLVGATDLLSAAQTKLNAAMAANPVGFVLTLLALLAFGLKQLYDRSETFRASVDSLFIMLRPLGALFGTLFASLEPLVTQLGRFFSSFSSGKGALDVFGQVVATFVVLPLKAMIATVQLAVDGLALFIDANKRVANFFGAGFEVDDSAYERFTKNITANAKSIWSTLTGQDAAVAAAEKAAQQQRVQGYMDELNRKYSAQVEANAKQKALAGKAAAEGNPAGGRQLGAEALKERLANIKAALALVQTGSAEELRLKKLEVATKRDIDLLGEKLTAADKKLIRAEALRDLRKLQEDYDKKQLADAEKRAKEEAEVQKRIADLKAGLLKDEFERRILELTAAAEKEKATAKGTAEQIAEQRKLIDEKLAVDVAAQRVKQAQKRGEEELDIERRTNALLKNEWDRRAAELVTAAKAEQLKILDTDAHAAEKRRLVEAKLVQDLKALGDERAAQEREIAQRIADIDAEIALRRIARRRQQSAAWSQERANADADEFAVRKQQLDEHYAAEVFQQGVTEAEKLAIARKYLDDKNALEEEFGLRSLERAQAGAEAVLQVTSTAVQALADFQKIATDKELAKLDQNKKTRLAKLDAEYKAGAVSKEAYEKQKASIEANYDAQTRQLKQQAAEKEKQYNIAQAIIAGTLAVIKVLDNPVLAIATGIAAAAGVAKIAATPLPEFEKGGFFGRAGRAVKQFATGGRINARAGVAEVGQRHSGGGIRMVDGATGEHLGEWERGEPYMILSRDTYANNKHLVDALIDTSLHRGGAPVRPRPGYYEDGGVSGGKVPAAGGAEGASRELVEVMKETRDAVRGLPSRQYIGWDNEDTAEVESRLNGREADRNSAAVQ